MKRPETQAEIDKFRMLLRGLVMQKLSELAEPAWDLAQACVKRHDPRGFDATMRGLAAGEKIAVSASGEARRVEHSGRLEVQADPVPAVQALRELLLLVRDPAASSPPGLPAGAGGEAAPSSQQAH